MRLILALLIAMLSMPAVAMPAQAAAHAPEAMAMHHHGDRQAPAQPERRHHADQACLGCIAPAAMPMPYLAPPLALAPMLPRITAGGGLTHRPAQPATPPPRAG